MKKQNEHYGRIPVGAVALSLVGVLSSTLLGVGCQSDVEHAQTHAAREVANEANTLTESEIDAGWTLLFDGKTTSGWRGYGRDTFPSSGWRVDQGTLVVEASAGDDSGSGGDIVTTQEFDNFELSLDFQLSDTSNSGIFYRVIENDEPIWHNAPEYQLLDDATYIAMADMDMTKHLTGDNYDLQSASVRPNNPIGEWNTARIVVDGAHVEHWLNGQKTVEYELWSPAWESLVDASKFADYPAYGRTRRGRIGLQDHGHTVRFRNVKIRTI